MIILGIILLLIGAAVSYLSRDSDIGRLGLVCAVIGVILIVIGAVLAIGDDADVRDALVAVPALSALRRVRL